MRPRGLYARGFFDLQLRFAHKVAALSGQPLARALLEYTNLYIRFGLGRDFDAAHPTWQEYLAGLHEAPDGGEWTYRFYLARPRGPAAPAVEAAVGCFSYARSGADRIRLHFRNAETRGRSPLSVERRRRRRAELAALFEHVGRTLGEPLQVVGGSWLYNLEAYRRLFPPSYVATAQVIGGRFQRMPLWGQFLDRRGEVRASMARQFLERLESQATPDGLERCFPLQVLSAAAPVRDFYDFYGVQGGTRSPRRILKTEIGV